jgi:hypothetical protein
MTGRAGSADGGGADIEPNAIPSDDLADLIALLDDFAGFECPVVVWVFFIFHAVSISQNTEKCENFFSFL